MTAIEKAFLTALTKLVHGNCSYVRTVEVRQVLHGEIRWTGSVAVIALRGHREATECYAWMREGTPALSCPVMMLNTGMIDSPAAAVRAHVRRLCVEMAA